MPTQTLPGFFPSLTPVVFVVGFPGCLDPRVKEDRNPLFAVAADGALTQARSERQWAGGRATVGITGGKHYYEATVQDDGLVRVAGP